MIVAAFVGAAVAGSYFENKELREAPHGAIRVVTVKLSHAIGTAGKYRRAGWTMENQSTYKSLVTQARITFTFRKG